MLKKSMDPFVVHEYDDWVFTLLRDMCLPPNLVTTLPVWRKKKKIYESFPKRMEQKMFIYKALSANICVVYGRVYVYI